MTARAITSPDWTFLQSHCIRPTARKSTWGRCVEQRLFTSTRGPGDRTGRVRPNGMPFLEHVAARRNRVDSATTRRSFARSVHPRSSDSARRQRTISVKRSSGSICPFPLLSDNRLVFTRTLRLPTFEFEPYPGESSTHLKRMALVIREGRIERVFYPVFPPDRNAEDVMAWLRTNP